MRDRTGVEQWQGSWSVPYRRESDTLPCRWSCSMGMTSAEHLQRPLPTTKQPVPLTARQAVLRGILFVRGGLHVGGLYRSAVGRMRFRDSEKNTPSPKFSMYYVHIQNFERGANTLHTARRLTAIADGGLHVKRAHLAHIFSHAVSRQSSVRQTRKSVTSRAGRENLK